MPWATPLCRWAKDCRPETCLLGVRLPAVQRARPQEELPVTWNCCGPAAPPVRPSSLASVLLPGAWVCAWFGIKALFEVVQQTRVSRGSPAGWHVRDSGGRAVARCPWTGCCWAGKLSGHVPSAMASAQRGVSGSPRGRSSGESQQSSSWLWRGRCPDQLCGKYSAGCLPGPHGGPATGSLSQVSPAATPSFPSPVTAWWPCCDRDGEVALTCRGLSGH